MSTELANKQCVPCEGGVAPLKGSAVQDLLATLSGDWKVVNEHHLSKTFIFKDFVSALAFVNRLGAVAEEQGHHPDIYLTWGKVAVEIWTHAIDGLSENDFILAAKFDQLPR